MRAAASGLGPAVAFCLIAACLSLGPGCRPSTGSSREDGDPVEGGTLEFRIVANRHDDKQGYDAACLLFIKARNDVRLKAELEERARAGKPPLPPVPEKGDAFVTDLGRHTYTWVELGVPQRLSLRLDGPLEVPPHLVHRAGGQSTSPNKQDLPPEAPFNLAEEAAARGAERDVKLRRALAAARDQGDPYEMEEMGGALLYSRTCQDVSLSQEERARKVCDYFLLVRDPEDENETVRGEDLSRIYRAIDARGMAAIGIDLDHMGADRMSRLTSKNAPARDGFRRFLAVIFDGQVISVPSLDAKIRDAAIIQGHFTTEEIDRYIRFLRAGKPGARK